MTNPYARAARRYPEIKAQAIAALSRRRPGVVEMERARDAQGRFTPDNPETPQNEAWVPVSNERS